MDVGVTGFVSTMQLVVPMMPSGGRVVAVSGLSGVKAYSELHLAMGTAKAALDHAVRYFAVELAPKGINVNGVCFGSVLSDGVAEDLTPEQYERFVSSAAKVIPNGRVPSPAEVVGAIGFLCSPQSGWVVGQVLIERHHPAWAARRERVYVGIL